MREWEDYYQILSVGPDASLKEIRAARNRKAFACHPDRNGQGSEADRIAAQEEMKRVNRAYEVLSNAHLRERFHPEWVQRNGVKGDQEIKTGFEPNAKPTPQRSGPSSKSADSNNAENDRVHSAVEPRNREVEWLLKGVGFGAVAGPILGAIIGTLAGLDILGGTLWVLVLSVGGAVAGFPLGAMFGGTYGAMLGEYLDRERMRKPRKPRIHG
jgi:hypothetical protein